MNDGRAWLGHTHQQAHITQAQGAFSQHKGHCTASEGLAQSLCQCIEVNMGLLHRLCTNHAMNKVSGIHTGANHVIREKVSCKRRRGLTDLMAHGPPILGARIFPNPFLTPAWRATTLDIAAAAPCFVVQFQNFNLTRLHQLAQQGLGLVMAAAQLALNPSRPKTCVSI